MKPMRRLRNEIRWKPCTTAWVFGISMEKNNWYYIRKPFWNLVEATGWIHDALLEKLRRELGT